MNDLLKIVLILVCYSPLTLVAQDEDKVPIVEILYGTIQQEGAKQGVSKYYELKRSDRDLYDFSFGQLNRLGLRLLSENKTSEAVEIFRLNLKIYPEKVTAHNNLADALVKSDKKSVARNYYLKGLEKLKAIDPIDSAIYSSYFDYGTRQIQIIDELNTSTSPNFTYHAYVGGIPAGNWDVDQLIKFKKAKNLESVSYRQENFYNAPVPLFIEEEFSGNSPDLVSGFVKGIYRDQVNQGIVSIAEQWSSENLDDEFPGFIKHAVSYNDDPYFLPVSFQWNPIWYRKDIFDSLKIEVPNTWEELLEVSEKLHQHGIKAFTVSGKGWQPPIARWFTILNLRLNGSEFFEEFMSGKISWNDPRIVNVFDHWKQMFDHHALDTASASNNWTNAVQELATGKAAMWNIGEWLFEFSPINSQIENFGVFPMPVINPAVDTVEILHLYGIHKLGITNPNSEDYLSYMASSEVQQSNHKNLSYRIPANKKSWGNLSHLQKQQLEYLKDIRHFVPLFEFNTHPEIAQAALDEFLYFWQHPGESKEVMDHMEALRKKIYSKN